MYEYKFIRLNLRGFWSRQPDQDYRAIVEEQARAGWRLVQIFAPAIYGYGRALFYELILERPRR